MTAENDKRPQPQGFINIYDGRGYTKFPSSILEDLGIENKEEFIKEIPFISHPNCVLLLNPNANLQGIIEGLDVLKGILKMRCK